MIWLRGFPVTICRRDLALDKSRTFLNLARIVQSLRPVWSDCSCSREGFIVTATLPGKALDQLSASVLTGSDCMRFDGTDHCAVNHLHPARDRVWLQGKRVLQDGATSANSVVLTITTVQE